MPDDVDGVLLAAGVPAREVEAARDNGTLLALLADTFLLPGRRTHTLEASSAAAGMASEDGRRLWRALGFPQPSADRAVFSDDDIEVLRLLLGGGTTLTDGVVQEARAISGALRRVADVLVDEIWRDYRASATDADAAASLAGQVDLERIERLLLHLLRRQLVASIASRSALATAGAALAVGFVDLVGFTALAQQMDVGQLGRLVEQFEATTYDIVADAGGRFVKTLGDGVLFTCATPAAAAGIALDALAAIRDQIGPARAAISYGPVVIREGDVFGPVVNLASRLVALADPDTALAPLDLGLPGLRIGSRHVRDIGEVDLVQLRRK